MDGFDPLTSFGPASARRYDDVLRGDEAETVRFLADLAREGPALELAIGTGRIALPLAATGIRVAGVEQSEAMVAQLRAKPGGAEVEVVVGDMSVDGMSDDGRSDEFTGERYPLVYLVFNTIFNLLTQDGQVACFENAARHLTDDGVFVVEAGVPRAWLDRPAYARPELVAADRVVLDVCRYDPVTQILEENHVEISAGGISMGPIACRLADIGELDLMARIAGLEVADRFGGWHGEPFTASSQRHVTVYRRRV